MNEEWFDLVDEQGRALGRARRSECHGNPALIHPSVHVLVFDAGGRLLLQRRSRSKDIQPGRWDSSVGGHLQPGEKPRDGALREMREELGVAPEALHAAHDYLWRSDRETEYVRTYTAHHDGPFTPCPVEIEEVRFWTADEMADALGSGVLTPNLEHEFRLAREAGLL